jgi:hypothetical protein
MKSHGAFEQCYDAQVAVDVEDMPILGNTVTGNRMHPRRNPPKGLSGVRRHMWRKGHQEFDAELYMVPQSPYSGFVAQGATHGPANDDATTYSTVGTLEPDSTFNDSLNEIDAWYRYQIKIASSTNRIQVWVWNETDSKPTSPGIEEIDGTLSSGLVGVVTYAGTGCRYWGPITVTSNDAPEGAYMAYEDFKAESAAV